MRVVLLLFFLLLAVTVEALVCLCDDCANGDTCEVGVGGMCYLQFLRLPNFPVQTRRRCYEPSSLGLSLCGTRNEQLVVECCSTDRCNEGIAVPPQVKTTTTTITTTTATPSPSSTTSVTTILGPMPTVQLEGSGEVTPHIQEYQCMQHHSSWPQIRTQCTTNTSCYWSVRRKNGMVIFKQGCSTHKKPCEQSLRSREATFCCTTNRCNDVKSPVVTTNSTPSCTSNTRSPTPTKAVQSLRISNEATLKLESSSVAGIRNTIRNTISTETITPSHTSVISSNIIQLVVDTSAKEAERVTLCATTTYSAPAVITVTKIITTTTTACLKTHTESQVTTSPTVLTNLKEESTELCIAVTGLGVGFLFTSVISSLVACVCMKLFFYRHHRHKHHHPHQQRNQNT